jgi:hypothetical protein
MLNSRIHVLERDTSLSRIIQIMNRKGRRPTFTGSGRFGACSAEFSHLIA